MCQCTVTINGYIPCKQDILFHQIHLYEQAATYTFCTIPCRGNKDCSDCPNDASAFPKSTMTLDELKQYVKDNNIMMYNPLP